MKRIAVISVVLVLLLTACSTQVGDAVVLTEPQTEPQFETVSTTVCTESPTEPTVTVTEPQYNIVINEEEVVALAKMAWGEAGCCSDMEIAATMWCVLNRVDARGETIVGAITMPYQYHGYSPNNPVDERIYNLAVDVLTRWQMEKQGASPEEVGRVLPPQYLYFYGDGVRNYFKDNYEYAKANIWDWSYPNPYETE